MPNDPQIKELLRLRLLRGYGIAYLNGTEGGALYVQGGDYYTKDDYNGNISSIQWAAGSDGWEPNDKLFKISLDKPWGGQVASYNNLVPRTTVYNNPSSGPGTSSEYGAVLSLPRTSGVGTGYGAFVSVGGVVNDSTRGDIWTFTGESGAESAGRKSSSRFGAVNVTNPDYFKGESGGSAVDKSGRVWWLGGNNKETDAGNGESQLNWFDPRSGESGSYAGNGEGTLAPTGTNWFQPSMVWVPVGSKGVLVAMGGTLQKSTTIQAVQMDKVAVFDIATEKWYLQTAVANPASTNGSIPSARAAFCAVTPVRAGSQRGVANWEIFFYGGADKSTTNLASLQGKDDFWALSMPSFTWTRLYTGKDIFGKWGRACTMLNDVYYAFVDISPTNNRYNRTSSPLLSFFDVTGTTFVPYFAPGSQTKTYSTPLQVQAGVDQTGNKPPDGFAKDLDGVFTAAANPPKSHDRAPAIAGGVIGGIALLAFMALAVFMWKRRQVRRRANKHFDNLSTPPDSSELDGNIVAEVHGSSIQLQPGAFATGKERYAKVPVGDPEQQTAPPVELPAETNEVDPTLRRPVAELQG